MHPTPSEGVQAPAARPKPAAGANANPKAWTAAHAAAKLPNSSPDATPHPEPGGLAFHGAAGVGSGTSAPAADAKAVHGTATAPYDPSTEINRLKSDGDTATFSVTAGGGFAVATPWTGPVNVGPQATAGYVATVTQVGGGGPGQPASNTPPKYAVTLEKNQAAGLYGTVNASAPDAPVPSGLAGKNAVAWLELNGRHADRVTMTFNTKNDAARAIRITQQEAEAQSLRDVSTVMQPEITIPDPVAAAKTLVKKALRNPLGTVLDTINPVNMVKAGATIAETAAKGALHDAESLFNNPLVGNNADDAPPPGTIKVPLPLGNNAFGPASQLLDEVATTVEPGANDKAFMQNHVTSYETAVTGQERITVEARLQPLLSIDGRVALNQTLTRTVSLPTPAGNGRPGKPGTVSYELRGGVTLDTRTRAKVGAGVETLLKAKGVSLPSVNGGQLGLGGGLSTVVPLGEVSASSKLTFAMTAAQSNAVQQAHGDPLAIPGFAQLGKPIAEDVTLQGRALVPQDAALPANGIYYANFKLQGSLAKPAETLGAARTEVMDGNTGDALSTLARQTALNGEVTLTKQQGGNLTAIPSVHVKDGLQVGEVWGLFTAQAQTDTVVARATGRVAWEDAPVPPQPQPPSSQDLPTLPRDMPPKPAQPQPFQGAVVPHEGLNIRAAPDIDAKVVAPTYSGTFLQATGKTRTDAQGQKWLEVRGPDVNRKEQKGWVDAQYVERHPEGAMAPGAGRIDQLRRDGYVAIRVRPGDTISGIALKNGADPKHAVAVNGGHVIDTDLIFPGDTVYIKKS